MTNPVFLVTLQCIDDAGEIHLYKRYDVCEESFRKTIKSFLCDTHVYMLEKGYHPYVTVHYANGKEDDHHVLNAEGVADLMLIEMAGDTY